MNAAILDAEDPLQPIRERFNLPKEKLYLCNNSLGLPPISAFTLMQEQLQRWAQVGVEGWFEEKAGWYTLFDNRLRGALARLLGAQEAEVIVMNSLTVNLHLLLVSFYRPTSNRYKILIESPIFPSDLYAIKSHLALHGWDPEKALIILEPRAGEYTLRHEDIEDALLRESSSLALVYFSSVNFLTGQVLDTQAITRKAKDVGAIVGFDLAHAAGNIPLQLHEWGVDFAVGCSYKYLCSGPGGPGLAYVHADHHEKKLFRLSGWWGNDPETRFQMQLQPEFIPFGGASSWQVSTPSILSMAPLIASLEIFDEIGMEAFRKKSEKLTTFLLQELAKLSSDKFTIITPTERGCQLSLLFKEDAENTLHRLEAEGVICDFRPPNILRVTPSPLYTSFAEIAEFVSRLRNCL